MFGFNKKKDKAKDKKISSMSREDRNALKKATKKNKNGKLVIEGYVYR